MPQTDPIPSGRALPRLAIMVVAGAGLVDATGFLSFGRLFLASPDANAIVAAVASSDNDRLALHAGGAILAFLAGVVLSLLAPDGALALAAGLILLLTASAWLVERRLRSENPSKPDGA